MKSIKMKGKSVEEAVKTAVEVLGGKREEATVKVINEGKPGMLGVLGGQDAEVEVTIRGNEEEDARQMLQEILDKMSFLTKVESKKGEDAIELNIIGEDMGRIIGKEGATLRSLEILLAAMLRRSFGENIRVSVDAGGYREKRKSALERLAQKIAEEVEETGKEKSMTQLNAADRRIVHLYLKERTAIKTFSEGEGRERRLIIAPK